MIVGEIGVRKLVFGKKLVAPVPLTSGRNGRS
jgi:hypothetical protein